MTNPEQVAARLMGIKAQCSNCALWGVPEEVDRDYMAAASCLKTDGVVSGVTTQRNYFCSKFSLRIPNKVIENRKVALRLAGLPDDCASCKLYEHYEENPESDGYSDNVDIWTCGIEDPNVRPSNCSKFTPVTREKIPGYA